MKALLTSTVFLGLVLGMTGCEAAARDVADGDDPGSVAVSDPGPAFADADWSEWTSTYTDVRPADEAALDELVKRTTAFNESAWTAEVEPDWLQIAYTPEHVRVRLRGTGVDVHLDPRQMLEESAPLTVCDDACTETSLAQENPGAQGGTLPARFGSAIAVLAPQLTMERLSGQIHDADVTGFLATLGSPVGPLGCFVTTPDGTDASELEGTPMVLDEPGAPTPVICVDTRGLAIMPPGGNLAPSYESWTPGVDQDVTELVAPQATEEPAEGDTDDAGVSNVTWDGWDPAYQNARMATPADLAELTRRVQGLNTSEWTAILGDDVELAVGPGHVRATIAQGATLHFDPASLGSFVLCVEGDGCVEEEVSPSPDEGDILTPMVGYFAEAVRAQRSPGLHLDDETAYAVLDSPVGPLDCLVGLHGADVRNLQGAPPDTGEGGTAPGTASEDRVCVDQHGLVLLGHVRRAPLLELADWQPGVPAGFDEHPEPEPAVS